MKIKPHYLIILQQINKFPDATMGNIRKKLNMTHSHVSSKISELESIGLLYKQKRDGRSKYIYLTEEGVKLLC